MDIYAVIFFGIINYYAVIFPVPTFVSLDYMLWKILVDGEAHLKLNRNVIVLNYK